MISAKRLEQLRDRFDIDNEFDRRDKYIAIDELIAARTRIAELEREVNVALTGLGAVREMEQLRAQGLSQEDRAACVAGANALQMAANEQPIPSDTPQSFSSPERIAERYRESAAILRRLGGQTK